MKLGALVIALLPASLLAFASAGAQERRPPGQAEQRRGPGPQHEERRVAAPRAPPPRFQAHPPGVHPHGPMVRQHPVRVLGPRTVEPHRRVWRRWEHPEFSRPVYYWDWSTVQAVTCTAEDSYGDQYPVTERAGPGFNLPDMTGVEDDALDRCYAESGGDSSCFLLTCTHF